MTRSERRQLERQQAKNARNESKKQILIDVATTLEDAKRLSAQRGMWSFQYESKVYLRVYGNEWMEYDVLPELLTIPVYREMYREIYSKAEGDTSADRDYITKQVMLTVFTTNLGNGSEYDMKRVLLNQMNK